MRGIGGGVVFVACLVRSVSAQPRPPSPLYPTEVTDRPVVLFAGMTELGFGLNFPTFVETTTNAMGNTVTTTTNLGDKIRPDFSSAHGFGRIDVVGGYSGNEFFYVGARMQTGCIPAVLSITLGANGGVDREGRNHWRFVQSASYGYRWTVVPGRLAISGHVGAGAFEATDPGDMPSSGSTISISAGGGATVQLTSSLALSVVPGISRTVRDTSSTDRAARIGTTAQLSLAFRRWDFYAQFALSDLTDTRRPFAAAGADHRFKH